MPRQRRHLAVSCVCRPLLSDQDLHFLCAEKRLPGDRKQPWQHDLEPQVSSPLLAARALVSSCFGTAVLGHALNFKDCHLGCFEENAYRSGTRGRRGKTNKAGYVGKPWRARKPSQGESRSWEKKQSCAGHSPTDFTHCLFCGEARGRRGSRDDTALCRLSSWPRHCD